MRNDKNIYARPIFLWDVAGMALPEFNIRLCGPTSTSKHIEVATRFGGDKGMLIQLNNTSTTLHRKLFLFNCSWISNHNGEDERLFFGGAHGLESKPLGILRLPPISIICTSIILFPLYDKRCG